MSNEKPKTNLIASASVVFQLSETEDGQAILTGIVVSDELYPGATSASAAAVAAAAAYNLFTDGSIAAYTRKNWNIDIGAMDGEENGTAGSTEE
jgi:hypothetical protein